MNFSIFQVLLMAFHKTQHKKLRLLRTRKCPGLKANTSTKVLNFRWPVCKNIPNLENKIYLGFKTRITGLNKLYEFYLLSVK